MKLRLYVGGLGAAAQRAERQAGAISGAIGSDCVLEIVNALDDPDGAERDSVIVTPTLMRVEPAPPRRVIGNLSDTFEIAGYLSKPPW